MTEHERQEAYKALGDVQRHCYDIEVGTRVAWPMPRSSESHGLDEQLDILASIYKASEPRLAQSLRDAAARIRALEEMLLALTRAKLATEGVCE